MANLLLDDYPLLVSPKLAELIGLEDALFLQHVHWLCNQSKNIRDGYAWVYNTYAGWKEQYFRFWSEATIKRIIKRLEALNVLITTNQYNRLKIDNTKWYRLDYEVFNGIQAQLNAKKLPDASSDSDDSSKCTGVWSNCTDACADCTDQQVNMTSPSGQNEQANNQRLSTQTSSMIDMGAATNKLSDKQIADWVKNLGWIYGINTSHPALVEAIAMGVLMEDLNYTLAEMQANNVGCNWKYFCKTLRTTVQHRLQAAQTLPAVDGLPTKRGAPAQVDTVAADVDLLVAGGVDAAVAEQWVAYRQSRRAGMLTQVFLDGLVQEGKSLGLGMSLHDVVVWCVSKGQVRFEAAWLVKEQETGNQGPQGVAYREFEPEPVVSAEEKQQMHAQGKLRSKELLARTKELLAGKAV